ncbi:furin-like protease 1 isoform X2 [Cimex lectularius]|nr:furin-like protease 1 isoform X2 [Cimex lectularius]
MYHLEHKKVAKRSIHTSFEFHDKLVSEKDVKWAKQQRAKRRRKRDFMTRKELGYAPSNHVSSNDPKWPKMWYLNRGQGLDMSVEGAWRQGITGKGIVVTILDDGLEKDHPDLKDNYDPLASYDVNNQDEDPMPRYDSLDSNRHGTRCAGEVAAVANNSICSLGIAYRASVGGVRMLDGEVTDAVEARSLSLNPQHIDIYSASWGPDDDGKTVDGPGELAMRAFVEGVTKGRGGKGSIFVWASGNGGRDHDNCNCDGYTNSIWTLSISSATEHGNVPWYSEACSSTLATTYSSGSNVEKQIVTTDLHQQCTENHTGTSASAPLAAGICALALEANTQLTWRDMQHIVVATAKPANLQARDWTTNGVGRNVSHSFGYGLMDAEAMVKMAKKWPTVPQQHRCEVKAPHVDKSIPGKGKVRLQLDVKECNGVNYLEHVQAKISLVSSRRGDIEIMLISPAGTKTILLAKRVHDLSRAGFRSWPFMSVHTWGEHPIGNWTLEIHNEARYFARLTDWNLIFYGTETAPGVEPELTAGKKEEAMPSPTFSQDNSVDMADNSRWKDHSQRTGFTSQEIHALPDEISSSGCQTSTRSCLECSKGWFLINGRCEQFCPFKTYKHGEHCESCHYSCKSCSGPNDYECTECFPDALLYTSDFERFCYPKALLLTINYNKWYFRTFIAFSVNACIFIAIGFIFYFRSKGCRIKSNFLKISSFDVVKYKLTNNDDEDDEESER